MLMKQHARTEWVSLLVWGLLMGSIIMFAMFMWDWMRGSGSLDALNQMLTQLPEGVRLLYGSSSVVTLPGWLQGFIFGGWLSLPVLVYTALFVTNMITREMDRRTMEFLLAQPVARYQVLLARWANLALALIGLHLFQFAGAWLGVRLIGEQPDTVRYLWAEANSVLVFLAVGSLLLACSLLVDDYGRGLAMTLGAGFGLYLTYSTTNNATGLVGDLRALLPFALFDTGRIIGQGQVPWADMGILALVSAVGLGLSVWLFQRKQISV